MKMQRYMAMGAMAFIIGFSACSDDDDIIDNPQVSDHDKNFMIQASYGNWGEVDMGKLADSISVDAGVKMFGQHMQQDHSTAQSELYGIADEWDVDVPDTPDSLHIALKQQMGLMRGHTFDTAYINGQIKDHEKTIALFEDAAANSNQQRLKDYANKHLPTIKMHKAMADTIALRLMTP
jgi:putative membrane protein